MEPERLKFGGPKELCGNVDLISRFKLVQHYEFFCKKSLPVSLSDSHYLHNVVGDTEIRKGEGMQLDELVQSISQRPESNIRIQPFDIDDLKEAFLLSDMTPVELPPEEKGVPTFPSKSKSESKDKDRKHKKHKDRDKEKDREHKKHKHKHKDRSKDKDKEKDRDRKKDKNGHHNSGDHYKKHHDKVRTKKNSLMDSFVFVALELGYFLDLLTCHEISRYRDCSITILLYYLIEFFILWSIFSLIFQKRKHDGEEDLNDIQRHRKKQA